MLSVFTLLVQEPINGSYFHLPDNETCKRFVKVKHFEVESLNQFYGTQHQHLTALPQ